MIFSVLSSTAQYIRVILFVYMRAEGGLGLGMEIQQTHYLNIINSIIHILQVLTSHSLSRRFHPFSRNANAWMCFPPTLAPHIDVVWMAGRGAIADETDAVDGIVSKSKNHMIHTD